MSPDCWATRCSSYIKLKLMSAQVQPQQHYYSEEDYLDLEEAAEYKSEYHDGEIFLMAAIDVQKTHFI